MISQKQIVVQLAYLGLSVVFAVPAVSQNGSLRISLDNDSKDGWITVGEAIRFQANIRNQTDETIVGKLQWNVHTVAFDEPKSRELEIRIDGGQSESFDFDLTCEAAGFADVEVRIEHNDQTVSAHSRVVDSPERVRSRSTKQTDFDSFWNESLRELAKVPGNFKIVRHPEQKSTKADVFEVRMHSFGDVRVAGWLEVPRTTGPHPIVIRVPGYGQNMRPIDRYDDIMVFSFNPRGHGNSTLDIPGEPSNYWIRGLDNKADYFYRGAYLDCVRAVDYIASRNDVDQSRIAVWGGSQGGGFAMATAALDTRIDLCIADIPFLCDWVNYFKLSHWPEMDEWIDSSPKRSWESTLRTLSYFDTMNLASRIQCPAIMGIGLQDKVCPPTTSFAAFNRIAGSKSFRIYQNAGHGLGSKHWNWVWKQIRREFDVDRSNSADAALEQWPQWLGPNREPVWHGKSIVDSFPKNGLSLRWKTPIGSGYSGPAVSDGRVFLMDRISTTKVTEGKVLHKDPPENTNFLRRLLSGNERVLCLEEETGKTLWTHEYDCPYSTVALYATGPRCTPTVDDDYVYALGAEGTLSCLHIHDGSLIWSHDLTTKYKVEVPEWGFAGHPLVDGDLLICVVGGDGTTCIAFDKKTGQERWSALTSSKAGYCPPVIYRIGNERHLVIWHGNAIEGLDPYSGERYWSVPFEATFGMAIGAPQIDERSLFIMCYNRQSALIQIGQDNRSAGIVWEGDSQRGVGGVLNTAVLADGHIYACGSGGRYICAKLATGERLWSSFAISRDKRSSSWGNVFTIRNGDRYFLANDVGDLIIAKMSPEGIDEISRTHLIDPTHSVGGRKVVWSHPAFANRSIYLRNDHEIRCYSLAATKP